MPSSSRKGFTIIELLVAVGVTALLVTLMINIVTTVLTNWNRTSGSLSSGNQARLVLDQISQDIQGAILKTDSNVWFAATVQATAPNTSTSGLDWMGGKPFDDDASANVDDEDPFGATDSLRLVGANTNLEDYRFGQGGVWLRFFTIPSGDNSGTLKTISAPRAVSYQIVRRRVGGSESARVYQLFRSEVTPDLTFDQGYDLSASGGYNTAETTNEGSVENIRSPLPEQVIASGVVDFGVRIYVKDTNNTDPNSDMVEAFPIDRTTSLLGSALHDAFAATVSSTPVDQGGGSSIKTGFPVVVEVMIRVLTPEGIRLLEVKEDPELSANISQSWWEIVEQNSYVYTRRIDLKASAL